MRVYRYAENPRRYGLPGVSAHLSLVSCTDAMRGNDIARNDAEIGFRASPRLDPHLLRNGS